MFDINDLVYKEDTGTGTYYYQSPEDAKSSIVFFTMMNIQTAMDDYSN